MGVIRDQELVNSLTIAASNILASLIQTRQLLQDDMSDGIDRAARAAVELREKVSRSL